MNPELPTAISAQQAEKFREDGFLCLRQIFDSEWIELLRAGLEKSMRTTGDFVWTYTDESDGRHFHNENRRWHEIDEYRRFIFESPVGEAIGRLAGWNEACLLFDSAFLRTAGTATKTPWHQDLPYLCVDGPDALVSAWIPLYPVGRESTLECVRGSHRWGKNYYRLNFDPSGDKGHMARDEENSWDQVPDIDADRDAFEIGGFAMQPGDALIIDGMMLHGSAGNLNPDRDLAVVTVRLLGDRAVYRPDKPGGVQPDLDPFAREVGLNPGDPVKSPLFPLVWSAAAS